jgi:hypothetical protein
MRDLFRITSSFYTRIRLFSLEEMICFSTNKIIKVGVASVFFPFIPLITYALFDYCYPLIFLIHLPWKNSFQRNRCAFAHYRRVADPHLKAFFGCMNF